ncbi:hypothetical protein [Candidatus Nitrotoga arctica]|uniref:hypothetical protein n=1 Tax=Candidatus Nitrotoga arctica TaxID=453162 RepID=UPI001EFBA973|nr:hypothetical protein [Candidatus Nitrotoga arctica]
MADKRYTLGIMVTELHKAGIRLIDNISGEASEHFAEFTDGEWRQLNDYLSHVADLHSTQFLIKGEGVQLNFAWNQGSNPQWRAKAPPVDDVLAFLHRLRPLILQEEPACFQKVRAVLKRRLKDAPIHPFMGWLLEVYEGKEMQKMISIQSNNCIVNSEKMLFTWLNAYEYHREREKQELLESYSKIMPTEWSRGVFLTLLVEKGKAISNLGALVEVVLGKRNALSLSV